MALNNTLYQIENLVIGLLEALNDKNNDVQESISLSLVELGKKRTDFILLSCRSFMIKNGSKLIESQRVYILNTLQKIIKEKIDSLEEQTAIYLIELSSNEMTQKEQQSLNIQTAASNLLVAIGIKYVKQVFTELLKQFNPGVLPHMFILNTMANLAEINAYGVVPQLSGVLASMLPMLGMAKLDTYKYAFASALSKFSEAILYYCSNKDKAPDKSIEKGSFSTQIYAAHEILFNVWIKTSDNKLRQTIIEAIGYFVNIIETEKLESDLGKIIPGILNLYKKHPDSSVVSQAICMIISAINSANLYSIESLLEMLLKELFNQMLTTVDSANSSNTNLIKNQNELLRCFTALAIRFCDKILPFLLQKMEQNNEKLRIASLTVIRHLINSSKDQMANKRELVLSGLRPLLTDSNNKVKRYLIQTIVAMGHHGYLHLEGGNLMIEFILKQCAAPEETDVKKTPQTDPTDNVEQLRSTAENVLTLFSTTVDNMHDALWPHLLEYLTNTDFTRALNLLCKNLSHIAEKKRSTQSQNYFINFNDFINLPKPYEIFSRLFVISGVPLSGKNRGLNSLLLLKNLSPIINDKIIDLWDSVIPKLILNLEDQISNNKFEHKKWEDLLMKMLSRTLELIQDEKEICEFGNAFGKQIGTLYNNLSEEKHFSYKCLGIILSKTENKSFIDKHLNIIFNSVNHSSQLERDGCAIAFGYAASIHLDTVLQKLETYFKNEAKKSGGLFSNILKDSKAIDPELLKATIVLCYGYVTLYSSQELIISRLEANILRSVFNFSANVRDLILKQNILKSLEIITKCMHPAHLLKDFNFSYKTNLIELMTTFISNENSKQLTNDIKSICFKVCSNLVKLNPKPSEAEFFTLIKAVTDSFYPLMLEDKTKAKGSKDDTKPQQENQDKKEDTDPNLLHGNALYETTANTLDTLLCDILDRDLNSYGLFNVYKHLEPWITSINDYERERAIRSVSNILKHFANNFNKNPFESQSTQTQYFHCFGGILGRLVCRSTDPVLKIRQCVVSSIISMMNVLCAYNQFEGPKLKEEQDNLKSINVCGEKLFKNDPNLLLNAVNELSKILCVRIPNDQIVPFIEKLVEGLLDLQTHCSVAACLILKHCVKIRGNELEHQVDTLIRHLYSKLGQIQNPQTKQGTLRTIRTIFQLHLIEALNVVLTFPIPCSKDMIDICQSITEDSKLVSDIIEHIFQIWSRCLPYEERLNVKYATMTPLIATCLLTELFSNNSTPETEEVFKQSFEKIFSALLLRLASTLNNQMPIPKAKEEADTKQDANSKAVKTTILNEYKKLEPIRISIDCFKSFIKCSQSYELQEYFDKENLWELLLQESTNVEACTIMAKGLCLHGKNYLVNIVNNLMSYLCAPYDCQKISVTAFFAELLNNECIVDLTEFLMNNLLSKLIDPCTPVRTLCIKGLGNISSLGAQQVQRHSTTILSAMMAGLDDKDDLNDDITLESMNGLSKIIALIDENNVRPILINILLRIRPCFEKDRSNIRSSAYILFGKLSRFGHGPSKEPFVEQIHSNFVSFILHLNENDQTVKKSCKYTLRQTGPLLNSESINELFQRALIDDVPLHYGEFINNLSKVLISDFPEKVSFYIMNSVSNFKSQWPEIRSNAVLFAGYLLGNLSRDKQSVLSKEHITNALIKLLKEDPSPFVRCNAAEAMSLLHDF